MEVVLAFLDPTIAERFEKLYWKQVYSKKAEQMTVEKWNNQSLIKKICCFLCYYVTRFAGKATETNVRLHSELFCPVHGRRGSCYACAPLAASPAAASNELLLSPFLRSSERGRADQ